MKLRSGHLLAAKCVAYSVYLGAGRFYYEIVGQSSKIAQVTNNSGTAPWANTIVGEYGPYWRGYRNGNTLGQWLDSLEGAYDFDGKPVSFFTATYNRYDSAGGNGHDFFLAGAGVPGQIVFRTYGSTGNDMNFHLRVMDNAYAESSILYNFDAQAIPEGFPMYFGASYGSQGVKAYLNGEDVTVASTVTDNLGTGVVPSIGDQALRLNSVNASYSYLADHLCAYAFDSELSAEEFAWLNNNPLGLLAPQRFYVPMTPPAIVEITEEGTTVIITDVNTTGTWQDGATGLVITGSGFV